MRKLLLRRRYIVDWSLQGSLCWHALFYGAVVLATICVGVFAPLLWELAWSPGGEASEEQSIVMVYMHERFWPLAGMCAVIVALGAIKFSHRIVGPMVRFKRNLRLLAEGKLPPPLRTRPGDYLQEEVDCLNRAVAGIADLVRDVREAQAALQREIDALAQRPSADPAALATLLAASAEVERRLSVFRAFDTGDARPAAHAVVHAAAAGVAHGG